MSKLKKIHELPTEDKVVYYLKHNKEFTEVTLLVEASRPLEFEEFLYSVYEFVRVCEEKGHNYFDKVPLDTKRSMH